MSRHDTKSPEGLVTSDATQGHRHLSRIRQVVGLIAVIVIIATTAGVYVYRSHDLAKRKSALQEAHKPYQQPNDDAFSPANALAKAQAAAQQAQTAQQKASAYEALGTAYLNNKQIEQAVAAYQSALSASTTNDARIAILAQLTNAYALAGRKSDVILTVQQLIQALQQSNNPAYQKQAAMYEQQLQGLEKGGS
jgi:tetratricopeptide (TPR) repeat protein